MQNRFNKVPIDISKGLENYPISSGMSYLILLSAPVGANVEIRLDNTESDLIPIKENYSIKFEKSPNIYITCNAIQGERIILGLAPLDSKFEIITSPQVNQIGEIDKLNNVQNLDNFSPALLSALDKIINPYRLVNVTSGSSNSKGATVLQTVLNCDKAILNLIAPKSYHDGFGVDSRGYIEAYLDNDLICTAHGTTYVSSIASIKNIENFEITECRGKILKLYVYADQDRFNASYNLQRFIKRL